MHILHVIDRYWPSISGSEIYLQELSERLAREGHEVAVYTTDAWDLEHFWSKGKRSVKTRAETHGGVQIRRYPVERLPVAPLSYPILRRVMAQIGRLPANTTPLLYALCRWTPRVPALEHALDTFEEPCDLIHAVNIPLDSIIYAASRLARRRRIPFVVTPFTHLGEPGDRRVRSFYTMPHQIEILRRADAVIVQTDLEVDALAACGVPREKMRCIGIGVDPAFARGGDAARFRKKYGIQGPIVFSVGMAAYDKGTMHLVEAMEKLWSRSGVEPTAATLVIAGPQMTQFRQYFALRSVQSRARTRVLGFIPEEDKRDLFAAGDVFALPSRTDSFGIVYLEAWLYNKPVIGAYAGGVPAVIRDGRDGFLVKFGDTEALAGRIEQLLTDRVLATRLGEAGCTRVLNELTWDKKYAQLRAVYQELAEASHRV